MKVSQFTNDRGVPVRNQFILTGHNKAGNRAEMFQSYDSVIVEREYHNEEVSIYLDEKYWDYSKTTSKYRNQFLGEDKKTTEKKIASGEYRLVDLNDPHNHTYVDDSGMCAVCSKKGE